MAADAYSAGKTSGLLMGAASEANKCYVLAHCTSPFAVNSARMVIIILLNPYLTDGVNNIPR